MLKSFSVFFALSVISLSCAANVMPSDKVQAGYSITDVAKSGHGAWGYKIANRHVSLPFSGKMIWLKGFGSITSEAGVVRSGREIYVRTDVDRAWRMIRAQTSLPVSGATIPDGYALAQVTGTPNAANITYVYYSRVSAADYGQIAYFYPQTSDSAVKFKEKLKKNALIGQWVRDIAVEANNKPEVLEELSTYLSVDKDFISGVKYKIFLKTTRADKKVA